MILKGKASTLLMGGALAATAAGGFLTSQAITANAQGDVKTETITIKNGEPGPAGPPGPKGDPGGLTCPNGFVEGKLIINHPGGQTTILACLEE